MVERAAAYADVGYNVSLYPLGSCVLHGLGVYDEYRSRGQVGDAYELYDGRGKLLQRVAFGSVLSGYGPILNNRRADLVDVLRKAGGDLDIRMGTTVVSLFQMDDVVRVELSDGEELEVDLVVGADGIHSHVREHVFGPQPVFDTGWVLRCWWARGGQVPANVISEYWGVGSWAGLYPTQDQVGFCVGTPSSVAPPAEELGLSDAATLPVGLARYAARTTDLVRKNQEDSRRLGKIMFMSSRAASWTRDELMKHYPAERLAQNIVHSMTQPF